MILRFSQKNKKEKWENKIRAYFNLISTKSTPDLLIKVCFFKEPTRLHGHYRSLRVHGFYNNEWNIRGKFKTPINHIITLKLCEKAETDESLFMLIAHEFRHYLQFSGKKPKQIEKDARKWSTNRFNKLIAEKKFKPKNTSYFDNPYWDWTIGEILSCWDKLGNEFEIIKGEIK